MAELSDENRAKILYTNISRLYNSSISHSLTLIVAWLAFLYASNRIPLDPTTSIIIVIVLVVTEGYSWIRVINFRKVLDQLETILDIDEFRRTNSLHSFGVMEFLFRGRRVKGFTIGEIIGSILLVALYVFTLPNAFTNIT